MTRRVVAGVGLACVLLSACGTGAAQETTTESGRPGMTASDAAGPTGGPGSEGTVNDGTVGGGTAGGSPTGGAQAGDDRPQNLDDVAPPRGGDPVGVAGKPHGLPVDDPAAARAEVRRRMVAEWQPVLAELPFPVTESSFFVEGDSERRRGVMMVYFPNVPEAEWKKQDTTVERALLAHGWQPPRPGTFDFIKAPHSVIGGCAVDGCHWTMETALLPPIVALGDEGMSLPELAHKGKPAGRG